MAFEYQGFATLGVNLNRQKYGPLDISNVFTSEADLNYYLSKGTFTEGVSEYWYKDDVNKVVPYPYEGQVLATVINGEVKVYVLRLDAEGAFEAKAIEPEVDGNTIKLTNGKLELVGLPTNTAGKTYVPSLKNGSLTWAEPDTSTVDGLSAAIAALDTDMTAVENRATALEETVNGKENVKGLVEKLADEVTARTEADNALTTAIADALEAAKKYADDNDSVYDDSVLGARVAAVEAKATNHEGRIAKVEAFFEAADHDGEEGGLNDALDTLVEIQDFLSGEGEAVDQMLNSITQNTNDIDALEIEFAANGRVTVVEAKVDTNEAAISAIDSSVDTLESISKSYLNGGEDAIKKAVDAAATKGQTGIDNAAIAQAAAEAAQSAADKAQGEVDALEGVVDGVKSTAEDAQARVGALEPKVEQAEEDIDALEAIVKTGADANATLRADVKALQDVVVSGADANATLRSNLNSLTGKVSTVEGTLATTTSTANSADSKVDAAVERLTDAEEAIITLQGVVETGDNTNAKLRTDITELQGIVKTGDDSNTKLRGEIARVAGLVENTTTGLAATKTIADRADAAAVANGGRLDGVEADYMRIGADNKLYKGKTGTDVIVFNCGTATTNI